MTSTRCAAWCSVGDVPAGDLAMLDEHIIDCPYCGESIRILIDASIPEQRYIEDCQVCCRPITLTVSVEEEGATRVQASGENDA